MGSLSLSLIAPIRGVGGGNDGSCGELGDRNVIRVPVSTVGSESDHYVGPGLVVVVYDHGSGGGWVQVGSQWRSALRPVRELDLEWEWLNA